MTPGEHILAIVQSDLDLAATLGDRIFPNVPTQAVAYPQAVYSEVGGDDEPDLDTASGDGQMLTLEIEVFAPRYLDAATVREQLIKALDAATGAFVMLAVITRDTDHNDREPRMHSAAFTADYHYHRSPTP